jgi:hypothetical protein
VVALVLAASTTSTFLPVKGEHRTIVVPDDYPTISAAIGNATDGDTIFIKKCTYEENPLEINKTLSLIGEGADSTKISFDPPYTEFTVNILEHHKVYENPIETYANGFKLSGFTIVNTGGYVIISGIGTRITDNKITTGMFVQGSYLMILENTFSADVGVSGSYSDISADIGYSMWINCPFCDFSLNSISGSDTATGIRFEISFCLNNDNDTTKAPYSKFSVGGNNDLVYRNIVDGAAFGLVAEGSSNTIYVNRITDCGIGLESGKMHLQNYARMASNKRHLLGFQAKMRSLRLKLCLGWGVRIGRPRSYLKRENLFWTL